MPAYRITSKAGRFVAGRSNTGAGSILFLTAKEAEYELSLGTIVYDGGDAGGTVAAQAPEAGGEDQGQVEGGEGGEAAPDLSKLTKAQLLALAAESGVTADDKMTKAQIIEAIAAATEAGSAQS